MFVVTYSRFLNWQEDTKSNWWIYSGVQSHFAQCHWLS